MRWLWKAVRAIVNILLTAGVLMIIALPLALCFPAAVVAWYTGYRKERFRDLMEDEIWSRHE